jgi:hypothetical protein
MQTILISPTKLDQIQKCPRLFNYLYVKELTSFKQPSYMERGDLFHYLLEQHYKAKLAAADYNIESIAELGRNHAVKLDLSVGEVEDNIRLFKEYVIYYQGESWVPEEVEVPFAYTLLEDAGADIRIVMEGKIDLLCREAKTNIPLIVDHKRVTRNFASYDRDNQKLAYALVTGRRDFVINQIGEQKSYSIDKRLQRYYFNITNCQVEEFVENTIHWTMEIIKVIGAEAAGDYIAGNYQACTKFNRKCMFYDVCNSPRESQNAMLEETFRPKANFDLFEEGEKE